MGLCVVGPVGLVGPVLWLARWSSGPVGLVGFVGLRVWGLMSLLGFVGLVGLLCQDGLILGIFLLFNFI